jgi:YidC/Oxa1 family membrane protein insertase
MSEIQKKYKNNPEKLNQETIELYKREKMSPFSGCLTSILQLVIILSVFWLVSQPLTYMKKIDNNLIDAYTTEMKESGYNSNNSYVQIATIDYAETKYQEISKQLEQENVENREELVKKQQEYNQLRLNMEFLGIDLSKVPTQNLNDWRVYVIPVLYVITSIISTKLTTVTQKKKQKQDVVVSSEEDNKEVDPTEQMQQMSNSMMYMIPVMSVMIAIIAPLGLALYWLTSNILMIIERLIINKVMEKDDNKEESSNG